MKQSDCSLNLFEPWRELPTLLSLYPQVKISKEGKNGTLKSTLIRQPPLCMFILRRCARRFQEIRKCSIISGTPHKEQFGEVAKLALYK